MSKDRPRQPKYTTPIYIDVTCRTALGDTGASLSVLSLELVKRLKSILPLQEPVIKPSFNDINTPVPSATVRHLRDAVFYTCESRFLSV